MKQRFIQSFSTSGTEQEALTNGLLGKPYIAYIEDGKYIDWNTLSPTPEPYSAMPLTFKIISGGTIYWKARPDAEPKTIEYKKNNGSWISITSSINGTPINVDAGDTLEFVGNNSRYASSSAGTASNCFSGATAIYNVCGNIMSLFAGNDFVTATTFTQPYVLRSFFTDEIGIYSAKHLVLPVTALTEGCYMAMFGNSSLVYAPAVLPATTLATNCYWNMFLNSSNLVTAPELPANALYTNSYNAMFYGCTNLNYIKCLATELGSYRCTYRWVSGVAPAGTFVKHPNASWTTGVDGIPEGWTVIDATD